MAVACMVTLNIKLNGLPISHPGNTSENTVLGNIAKQHGSLFSCSIPPCGKEDDDNMIGCYGEKSTFAWFHYSCVGLDELTILDGDWLCTECRGMFNELNF